MRNENNIEQFIETVDEAWQLSVLEKDFLETSLTAIFEGTTRDISEWVDNYTNADWDAILTEIPNYVIQRYVEDYLDLVEQSSVEEKTLEDFDDEEIEEEYFDRFGIERIDIVAKAQLEEMTELFYSLDFISRENVLKELRK